ncbi:PAS domain S-box protein [Halobacteria archaeon AArc-curdl1]|uniref:PAS domain S-box protein n=1 Tax=Natronosalvus hydrolyticus TaxID=2979988 RepID=A0AAP2Z7L5_9EURY|nr:PAS domain S-box protein [Halobacteria archaeon AArc-curdl1]
MEPDSLTDALRETLAVFDERGTPQTTPEVADSLDLGRRSTYARLERLVEQNRLETKKVGANARVWWLPQEPASSNDQSVHTSTTDGIDADEFASLVAAVEEYAIFTLDTEGHVRSWNTGAKRIKGYEAEDILGEHFSTFYTDEDREATVPERNLEEAARNGSVEDEGWRVRADGTRFWGHVTITAIRNENGTPEGYVKVTRDMTDRREYERRLEGQTERLERQRNDLETELQQVYDRISDGFYALDEDLQFTYINDHASDTFDLNENVIGMPIQKAVTLTETFETNLFEAVETQESVFFEDYYGPLNKWFVNAIYPSASGLSVYFREITDQKQREHELERYERIIETVEDGIYVLDSEHRFTMVNSAFASMTGREPDDLIGAHASTVFTGEFVDIANEKQRQLESGELDIAILEENLFRADGTSFVVESRFDLFALEDGKTGRVGVTRDITGRKRRERELARFQRAVEASGHAIYMIDVDGEMTYANPAFEEITGYSSEEVIGETPMMLRSDEHGDVSDEIPWERVSSDEMWDEEITGRRKNGNLYHVEQTIAPVTDEDDEIDRYVAVQKDITDRKEQKRELETQIRQQEVVTHLGQLALENDEFDALLAEAVELVADTLDTDYCKVLHLDGSAEALLVCQGVGWHDGIVGEATVPAVDENSQAAYTLETAEPVVVENLETEDRFNGPDLLTNHGVKSGISTIIGSHTDPWGILGTHDTDQRSFSEQDINFVQSVANLLASAIDRREYEQELLHQREELTAFVNLNEVFSEITAAVIDQSTREEIEATVCDHLAASDSYVLAWIGDVSSTSQMVNVRAESGAEEYLEEIAISVDPDDKRSCGPTGKAFLTGELQTAQEIHTDPTYEPWRETAREHGFRSSAAVPIVHENQIYGVLNVYSDRPHAFDEQEGELLSQLGEIIGHSIAATERKQALMSDELVEVEVQVQDVFGAVYAQVETEGTITFDRMVNVGTDEYLVYGTATQDALETLTNLVEVVPQWDSISIRSREDPIRFELRLVDPPILTAVTSLGGYIKQAVIENGNYQMTVHLAPSVDVRRLIDDIGSTYPRAEMLSRRQITRARDNPQYIHRQLVTKLTERQYTTLDAAYHAGFFEWPRNASGEKVAESLDIAPATFSQHLRKAEQKVFDSLFSFPSTDQANKLDS